MLAACGLQLTGIVGRAVCNPQLLPLRHLVVESGRVLQVLPADDGPVTHPEPGNSVRQSPTIPSCRPGTRCLHGTCERLVEPLNAPRGRLMLAKNGGGCAAWGSVAVRTSDRVRFSTIAVCGDGRLLHCCDLAVMVCQRVLCCSLIREVPSAGTIIVGVPLTVALSWVPLFASSVSPSSDCRAHSA